MSRVAAVANNAGADAFVRIHANGSEDSGQNGILTICPTLENPYMGNLYSQCRSLSESVLDGAVNATGANKQYIWDAAFDLTRRLSRFLYRQNLCIRLLF